MTNNEQPNTPNPEIQNSQSPFQGSPILIEPNGKQAAVSQETRTDSTKQQLKSLLTNLPPNPFGAKEGAPASPGAAQTISAAMKTESKKPAEKKGGLPMVAKLALLAGFLVIGSVPWIERQVGGNIKVIGAPSESQAFIRPSIAGTIDQVFKFTDDDVKAGDPIVKLKNWDLQEKILNVKSELARQKANLQSVGKQINIADREYDRSLENFNLQKAQSNFVQGQATRLTSQNLPPRLAANQKQYEQLKLQSEALAQKASLHKYLSDEGVFPRQQALQSAYDAASSVKQMQALSSQMDAEKEDLVEKSIEDKPRLNEAKSAADSNYSRLESVREQKNITEVEINNLENQLALLQDQEKAMTLSSPISGKLLTLGAEALPGQNFNRGDTIAVVGDLKNKVRIEMQIPEEDREFIKEGQPVDIHIKALHQYLFQGEVDSISPVTAESGEDVNKKLVWKATIILDNTLTSRHEAKGSKSTKTTKASATDEDNPIKPGTTGYARIQTGQKTSFFESVLYEVYKAFRLDRFLSYGLPDLGKFFSGK